MAVAFAPLGIGLPVKGPTGHVDPLVIVPPTPPLALPALPPLAVPAPPPPLPAPPLALVEPPLVDAVPPAPAAPPLGAWPPEEALVPPLEEPPAGFVDPPLDVPPAEEPPFPAPPDPTAPAEVELPPAAVLPPVLPCIPPALVPPEPPFPWSVELHAATRTNRTADGARKNFWEDIRVTEHRGCRATAHPRPVPPSAAAIARTQENSAAPCVPGVKTSSQRAARLACSGGSLVSATLPPLRGFNES